MPETKKAYNVDVSSMTPEDKKALMQALKASMENPSQKQAKADSRFVQQLRKTKRHVGSICNAIEIAKKNLLEIPGAYGVSKATMDANMGDYELCDAMLQSLNAVDLGPYEDFMKAVKEANLKKRGKKKPVPAPAPAPDSGSPTI